MKTRQLCFFCLLLLPACLYGQDTTYYNQQDNKVKSIELASFYAVLYPDSTDAKKKTLKNFFLSGKLKSVRTLLNYNPETKKGDIDGKFKQWYENGQLRNEIDYKAGKIDGKCRQWFDTGQLQKEIDYISGIIEGKYKQWYDNGQLLKEIDCKNGKWDGHKLSYWKNGKLRRQEEYAGYKFISGKCFNPAGIEIDYSQLDTLPAFPGGLNALIAYVSRELKYPELPRSMGVQGTTYVRFLVGKDGLITNIEVGRTSGCDDLDHEALRVVKTLSNWKPGILDDEAVSVNQTLPINFKLDGKPDKLKK